MAASATLNIIGGGRVGSTLTHLWHQQGTFTIQDVLCTTQGSAEKAVAFMGAGRAQAQMQAMAAADVWMLSVPDAHIGTVAQALAAHAARHEKASQRQATVFHCSGAMGSELLAPLQALGWQVASAHCILSFATANTAVTQFAGTPCALEGDADALVRLEKAFTAVQARCFTIQAQDKLLYHAAAVFATNFLPVLQSVAEDLWRTTGVPDDIVLQLRASLLKNAVSNILAHGPEAALTGPAARGDMAVIYRQGKAVTLWDPGAGAAYDTLSQLALRLKQSGTEPTRGQL
jgi:predicted short-subunit dehydrogenase-like oxidoreductase (DUF2520 family)